MIDKLLDSTRKLYDAASGGEGGGGGGGGAGAGSGNNAGAQGGDASGDGLSAKAKEEVNSILNSALKGLKKDFQKLVDPLTNQLKAVDEKLAELAPEGDDDAANTGGSGSKKVPPEVQAEQRKLRKQLEDQTAQVASMKADLERERLQRGVAEADRLITAKLAAYEFVDKENQQAAFRVFRSAIRHDDDGNLVADHNGATLTYEEYIDEVLPKHFGGFLKPKQKGGAGAGAGGGAAGNGKSSFDTDEINAANMSDPAKRKQAAAAIAQHYSR